MDFTERLPLAMGVLIGNWFFVPLIFGIPFGRGFAIGALAALIVLILPMFNRT